MLTASVRKSRKRHRLTSWQAAMTTTQWLTYIDKSMLDLDAWCIVCFMINIYELNFGNLGQTEIKESLHVKDQEHRHVERTLEFLTWRWSRHAVPVCVRTQPISLVWDWWLSNPPCLLNSAVNTDSNIQARITYLEINLCLINTFICHQWSKPFGRLGLSGLCVHSSEMILLLTWFCSLQLTYSQLAFCGGFTPRDYIFTAAHLLPSLDLLNKAGWELNPLMSLMHTNILWQFQK